SKLVTHRKTLGRQAAGLGARSQPVAQIFEHILAAAINTDQAFLEIERGDVGELAVFVFLQNYATPARHLRNFGSREDQQFAVGADGGGVIAAQRCCGYGASGRRYIEHLLAALGLRQYIITIYDEAAPVRGSNDEFLPGLMKAEINRLGL